MTEDRAIGLGSGLAGVILAITIAWALAAVLMLTGTLNNSSQINDRVKAVNAQVAPIDKNLSFVRLAGRTGRIAKQIRFAAKDLSSGLGQVITVAGQINITAGAILGKAQQINGVVNQINTNALSINGTVHSINTTVHSINSSVNSINSNVQSIAGSVASIGGNVASIHSRVGTIESVVGPIGASDGSINANVTRIHNNLGTIRSTAQSIRVGVIGINNRAQTVIGLSALLKADFDKVLGGVGTALNTPTVLGHANSIDCSRVVNLLGPTRSCNK